MRAWGPFSARLLLAQAAALFGVGLTLAMAVRWGPPGWEGPWPLTQGMAALMQPAPPPPVGVGFVFLTATPRAAGLEVEVFRDGWAVGALGAPGLRLAVHPGDVLSLRLEGSVPVTVRAVPDGGSPRAPDGVWRLGPEASLITLPRA